MAVFEVAPRVIPGVFGRMVAGVAGGLSGGVVFGVVMQLGGTIPMVAQLVERESWVAGWGVHMSIAAFVGLTFALIFGFFAVGMPVSTLLGAFYGLIWWVLGGLTLMPLRLGMGLFVFDDTAWQSLFGHLAYGLVLGAVYAVAAHLALNAGSPAPGDPAAGDPAPDGAAAGPPDAAYESSPNPTSAPSRQPAPLPRRSAVPPPGAGSSILEFVLPPVEDSSPAQAAPAGAGELALSPDDAGALRPRAERAEFDDGGDRPPPGRNPWEVRQHRQ